MPWASGEQRLFTGHLLGCTSPPSCSGARPSQGQTLPVQRASGFQNHRVPNNNEDKVRKVPGGKSELVMPFRWLLEVPVSWAVGWLGGKSRTGDFLLMPTVEVPTLAPTTSAARVGNQQPTFFRASQSSCHFYFCNFVLMKSAFIPIHLHCPLFKPWRLQTYPGVIFKQTKNKQAHEYLGPWSTAVCGTRVFAPRPLWSRFACWQEPNWKCM